MLLTDILKPESIKVPLAAQAKQDAIFELVELLAEQLGIDTPEDLKQAVWLRETTRTTGIGHGIAIPHGKSGGCSGLSMAVGKPALPLDFGAIDGRPVELIFLLVSPPDQTGPHIQALAGISRMLSNDEFRGRLKRAESADEMYRLIAQNEAQARI